MVAFVRYSPCINIFKILFWKWQLNLDFISAALLSHVFAFSWYMNVSPIQQLVAEPKGHKQ